MNRLFLLCVVLLNPILIWAQPANVWVEAFFVDSLGERLPPSNLANGQTMDFPVPGQHITLAVDVYTRSWFTAAPKFPHLSIADTINLKSQSFAINYTAKINGESYAAQRREYGLFPQRAGQFVINGIEVKVQVASNDGKSTLPQTLRSNPLLMQVAELKKNQAQQPQAFAVTTALSLQQSFSSGLDNLRVGDIVERRIEITANSTMGMLIPALTWPSDPGVRQVSGVTAVNDDRQRGQFTGRRTETRFYTLLNSGELILPALWVDWWDVSQRRWRQTHLSELPLQVAAGKSTLEREAQAIWRFDLLWPVWLLLAAMALVGSLILLWRGLAMRAKLKRWQQSEVVLYRRLQWALCQGQGVNILQCYYRWRGHRSLQGVTPPLQALLAQLYGVGGNKIPKAMAQTLTMAIRQQRKQLLPGQVTVTKSVDCLPDINAN